MKKPAEKDMVYIFLTIYIFIQCFILLFSESVLGFGGRENISYYQTAKYLLPDSGLLESPLYVTFLAPFAQLGYFIARVFNLLVAAATLIFLVQVVKRLYDGRAALFVVVLTAFSPVYFRIVLSNFPEVLLGFLLVASVYLFISRRYLWSAFVVSLIPVVIPAAVFILPVFALALYIQKSFKAIPLLLSGIIISSAGALIVFDNFLLPIQTFVAGIWNTGGDFSYTLVNSPGAILFLLTVAGFIIWLYELIGKGRLRNSNQVYFILIGGSLLVYYSVSHLWFSKNQLELIRATGALVPLMALMSLKTVGFIRRKVQVEKLATGFLVVAVTIHVLVLFLQPNLLMKATPEELAIKEAASFLRYNEQGSKLYCSDPLLAHFLELNPRSELLSDSIPGNGQPSENMNWGDVLVWTSKHENYAAGIKQADLLNDTSLTIITSFIASNTNPAAKKEDFNVHLFKKEQSNIEGSEVEDYYKSVLNFNDYLDERVKSIDEMKVWELDSAQEYSPAIRMSPDVVIKKNFYEITAKVDYKALQPIKTAEVLLVCSVEKDGKSLSYNAEYLVSPSDKWEVKELNVTIPADFPNSANVNVYLWNKERKRLLIDEISVAVKSY